MDNQTLFAIFKAEIIFRMFNRKNQRNILIYALLSIFIGVSVYLTVDSQSPMDDAITLGSGIFIFFISFFTLSSVTREISDGTVSLSLRFVPQRKKLFFVRMLFWPFITLVLSFVLSALTIPFVDTHGSLVLYIADSVLYNSFIWSLMALFVFFVATIFRKGALSLLMAIGLLVFLPLFLSLSPLIIGFNKITLFLIKAGNYTPTLALTRISSFRAINNPVEDFDGVVSSVLTVNQFVAGWLSILVWLSILGVLAWMRFQRESSVNA